MSKQRARKLLYVLKHPLEFWLAVWNAYLYVWDFDVICACEGGDTTQPMKRANFMDSIRCNNCTGWMDRERYFMTKKKLEGASRE